MKNEEAKECLQLLFDAFLTTTFIMIYVAVVSIPVLLFMELFMYVIEHYDLPTMQNRT
jgi:hypothetical protein